MSLGGYFDLVLDQLAPAYRPEDVYAGNYLGSLEAIDAGVTTLLDWSHITTRPSTPTRRSAGSRDAGSAPSTATATRTPRSPDWWFDSELEAPEDIRRVRDRYFSSDDGLMTLAMGTRGPGFCKPEVVRHDWELARDVGAPISVHVGMGPWAGRFSMVSQLNDMGLLGPDTTYIHCNYLSDEEFQLIADTGGKVSISPSVEMAMGHGTPPTARGARARPPAEPQHRRRHDRAGRHVHADAVPVRLRPAARARGRVRRGQHRGARLLTTRDVLEFATIEGARVCGLEDRTGSLTPGKQADVVVIRCDHSNTYPVIDPVSTVVHQADTRNIDTVMVAGEFLKRDGALVDADLRRARDHAAPRSTICSSTRRSSRTGSRARARQRVQPT